MTTLIFNPPKRQQFTRKLPSHDVEITVDLSRGLFFTRHRGQIIEAGTLDQLVDHADQVEDAFLLKRERARLRKLAETTPLPALRCDAHCALTPVVVRGADQRTGNALITLPDGRKDKTPSTSLLRSLTDEETATHEVMHRRYLAALRAESATKGVDFYDHVRAASGGLGKIEAAYDPQTAEFFCQIDEARVAAPTYGQVVSKVEKHVFATAMPWHIRDTGRAYEVRPNTWDECRPGYPTRELAEQAAGAATERAAAWGELWAWVNDPDRRFDLSWATTSA